MKWIPVFSVMIIATLSLTSIAQKTSTKSTNKGQTNNRNKKIPAKQSNSAEQQAVVPLVDHHQHLLSASSASADSKLRVIQLPEALDRLVRERELHWNNSTGLINLFDEDVVLFAGTRWISSRKSVADFLANGYTGPYRFKPISYRIDGSSGQIAGYMVEDDGTNVYFAFFHHILSKGKDSGWRIKSETQIFPGPALDNPVTADQLVRMMDSVGIRKSVVMSNAYYFGSAGSDPFPDEYKKVRAENDWTGQQVSQFPDRLIAFCSFHPLKNYALEELNRCASSRQFKGLKLHLNGAQLNFQNLQQVEKVKQVMKAANKYRLPMVIHVRSSNDYGRKDAEVFLHQLVAAAPDVPIQIAHLWGGESFSGAALAVYAEAVAAGNPVAKNLYFDISGVIFSKPEEMPEIVARIRQIGLKRILYASDGPPSDAWETFRQKMPLTDAELRKIANNIAPYLR